MNDDVVTIPFAVKLAQGSARPPFLRLGKQQAIPGYLHGLIQPALTAQIALSSEYDLRRTSEHLEAALRPLLPSLIPLISVEPADVSPTHRFVHLLGQLMAALQEEAGLPVTGTAYVKEIAAPTSAFTVCFAAFPSLVPVSAARALQWLAETANALVKDQTGFLPEARLQSLQDLLETLGRAAPEGTNNRHFIRAAQALGIPFVPLPGRVFQFGWGQKARLFRSSLTDATPAIGTAIARNKRHASLILAMAGLPVPEQVETNSIDAAIGAAEQIGYPVVLKPADQDQGLGVSPNLRSDAELRRAYERAKAYSSRILLERHVVGHDYRINVLDGAVYSVARRVPAGVTGDGIQTIAELIAETNNDPRRSTHRFSIMKPLTIDSETKELLELADLTTGSIPEMGQFIPLARAANTSRGGYTVPITDDVHPDNIRLCEDAARLLRLDIAGIDLIIPDIAHSWREVGGAICEVNAQPQMGLLFPEVFKEIFTRHVKDHGRIPVALIIGGAEAMELAKKAARQISSKGMLAGCASDREAHLGPNSFGNAGSQGFNGIRALLMNPDTQAAVFVRSINAISKQGLPVDRIDALAICEEAVTEASLASFLAPIIPHLRGDVLLAKQDQHIDIERIISGRIRIRTVDDIAEALQEMILPSQANDTA